MDSKIYFSPGDVVTLR
jgi:uncharacterized protein YodC (DUF2158 family)